MVNPRPTNRPSIFDWTATPPPPNLTPFQKFVRDVDWTSSPLGPMEEWPAQLRQMVCIIMADPSPAVVYWGEATKTAIVYNEPYTHLIGKKHPALMGTDPKIGFAEVWDQFEELLLHCQQTGLTVVGANEFLLLQRQDFLEETYFSWKFIPIIGEDGYVVGNFATVVEATKEVINDRRMATIQKLTQNIALARNVKELWPRILRGLEENAEDIPLAILYSVQQDLASPSDSRPIVAISEAGKCMFEAALGVSEGHKAAPNRIDLETDSNGFAQAFRDAMSGSPQILRVADGTLPEALLDNIEWRGFGVPCDTVVVCPLLSSLSEDIFGFMVIGLNPRRPYNKYFESFIDLITRQVTTPHVSAVILGEEVKRRQRIAQQAAFDQAKLSAQLSARTKEFLESEAKFHSFAFRVPVGLAILNPDGTVIYSNEFWYAMARNPQDFSDLGDRSWLDACHPEDRAHVEQVWIRLLQDKKTESFQARMIKPPSSPGDSYTDRMIYVLCNAYVDLDDDGNIRTIMACLTDISAQKAAEDVLRTRMTEALETKRQQENFIDMTSHEMRNPISAILHSAEEILQSLKDISNSGGDQTIFEEMAQAAETILYCSNHQRRIVDDILTLSRLDHKLLTISPAPVQPILLVRNALRMFDPEFKTANIELAVREDPSMHDMDVGWLMLDSGRVLQILINLFTNAIKFTRLETQRVITVTISASLTRPRSDGVQYVPTRGHKPITALGIRPADDQAIYFCLAVKDTGRGLTDEEKKMLFNRFSQASPKTHTQYGGSGLGLFISRQLSEMQGGGIGFASEFGRGSTFEFYVKSERAPESPDDDSPMTSFNNAMCINGGVVGAHQLNLANTPIIPSHENPKRHSESLARSEEMKSTKDAVHILVVEDNLMNQKVVVKQLQKHGCIVNAASHGEEALAFIRTTVFWKDADPRTSYPLTVVLMDCEMPVMDGLTAVRRIRTLQTEAQIQGHVPVIAVTANARDDQITAALEAGMDDVITKPYRIADLLVQIRELSKRYPGRTNGSFASNPLDLLPTHLPSA